ncbi:hypothetical protein [Streptosporangium sp. OZ121]|uniref:hypothetical protein n=1 Tax=Streptosporangium sp. OZ121 TaxID=3444183 RepID=UPI003F78C448
MTQQRNGQVGVSGGPDVIEDEPLAVAEVLIDMDGHLSHVLALPDDRAVRIATPGRLESLQQASRDLVCLLVSAACFGDVLLEVGPAVASLQGGPDLVLTGCDEGAQDGQFPGPLVDRGVRPMRDRKRGRWRSRSATEPALRCGPRTSRC